MSNAEISTKRHSLSHVLAQAVQDIYPTAKKTIGPDIETGFYFDFDFGDIVLKEEDLKDIEKRMKNIIRQNQKFERYEMTIEEATHKANTVEQNPYKAEILEGLKAGGTETVSYYKNVSQQGDEKYEDLCRWPHVEKMAELDENAFCLDKIAGAYWKGDSKNKMLTRIYGLAFESKAELDEYKKMMEEAKRRDHRILGKKLKIFTISELIGAGLPLLQPNGMTIRKELEDYLWSLHANKGYSRVWTPHIAKEELYITSGHAAKFGDELFRVSGKEEKFIMKPMNCPHHMQIFTDNQFSYRDMPVRYFEPATVYRDEKSGQLSGLTRVRAITQDDGHLFCRQGQITEEVKTIVGIIRQFYTTFGLINNYWVSLSVRWEDTSKYLGSDEVWNMAENALEEAAKENELNYRRMEGEAAFYGPKLDFMFKDAIGREWQLATIQCDFNLPERFNLSFTNELWEKERPVVIHRAISGSLERFMAIMIEHFAGVFPLWLAPRQVIVVPVAQTFDGYAQSVVQTLKNAGIRAEADYSDDSFSKKIRNAEQSHINYIVVVGEKEANTSGVAVRNYKTKAQTEASLEEFVRNILSEITNRSL